MPSRPRAARGRPPRRKHSRRPSVRNTSARAIRTSPVHVCGTMASSIPPTRVACSGSRCPRRSTAPSSRPASASSGCNAMATRATTKIPRTVARTITKASSTAASRSAKKQTLREGYTTLAIEIRNAIAEIALDRPDVHNAFDETLIAELTDALTALDRAPEVRAVVLRGAGRSFCAGADLNWMRRTASYGKRENLADARALAQLLATLAGLSKPTLARAHGNACGGGVGLGACCDVAGGAQDAVFALSEAKLGLVPATIGPYVVGAKGA